MLVMKKILSFVCILTFSLSCSTDSGNTDQPNGFLKKITSMSGDGEIIDSNTYIYNGEELRKILRADNTYTLFYYTDDRISKVEYYDEYGHLAHLVNFGYDNSGRLISENGEEFTSIGMVPTVSTTFTINPDNTIDCVHQMYNSYSSDAQFVLDDEGAILESHRIYENGYETHSFFEYDNMHDPLKGIKGYYLLRYSNEELFYFSAPHNITSVYTWYADVNGGNDGTLNFAYQYNNVGYPITRQASQLALPNVSGTLIYEYY